ncbi:hypothetical protein PYCCODRAFT_1481453 [Trametes coccinea BRFM310]|uniref:Telomere-associated protein Rif1 N-terminal domain-containing protein n=1 Tax=Trametes coccinea (strain BRFM310) TaxID=1353009 RepID=A0A1Y2I9U9_TRAC3|nr:hypothetical protein PYCCODRAFT_1481453 [Trametes coccinea BRFM310]
MSLPTPPATSHRDEKENRAPRFTRVSWSETAQYRAITASPPRTASAHSSASRAGPSRSILKRTTQPITPLFDENAKEGTPEPSDPLTDLHYLDGPVSRILAEDPTLRDSIEGYSILAARLRACVADNTDADASWPLFQPIRKQRDLLVQAMVRDIRQVFNDPLDGDTPSAEVCTRGEPSSLPSPRESPKKKRGMSAEQVKRARDLCGVCHAVLKLLCLVFTLPALYQLFTEDELGYILTQVLAIPLANELPTPNARKTCALAIAVIQTQRLPAEVLEPAKDRIAYALRRGIEGELGKEGKKGSVSDGLKAIHDLSLYQPSIFVPAFAPLVPAVLSNLLANTLPLRNQACHALGGLALAAASLPPSEAHTRISTAVASRLVRRVAVSIPLSPSKKAIPGSPSHDSPLVRTLRTTLNQKDPKYASQGPVWAFSVIAHLVVLLGPTVYLHSELTRTIMALFSLGMHHGKSSVRGLGCLAWRTMIWAYFRPPHVKLTITTDTDDEGEDSATEEDLIEERVKHERVMRANFENLLSIVDMGAGVNTVGAILGQELTEDIHVHAALRVLAEMVERGGHTCKEAMDVARQLLGSATTAEHHLVPDWDHRKLLAPGLFSANPGLLTADWKTLSAPVKGVLDQCPSVADIRPLTLEEIATDGVWDEFLTIWKAGLSVLRLQWGSEEVPSEVREIWFNLLKGHAKPLLDAGDYDGLAELSTRARDVLVWILDKDNFDFTMRKEELGEEIPTSPVKPGSRRKNMVDEPLPEHRWNHAVKLFLVRDLFGITRAVFPLDIFAGLAESVLQHLNSNEEDLVGDLRSTDEVREQWASLCAEAALVCDIGLIQAFWTNKLGRGLRCCDWTADVRALVWQTFLERWEDGAKNWEAAIVLLSVPFIEASGWELGSEELNAWEDFLKTAMNAALDCGVDASAFLDHIAAAVAAGQAPGATSAVRVADLLLSQLDFADAREVPMELFEFTSDTLTVAYPPAPRHKVMCMWLIRSLTRVIDACPAELCFSTLQTLSEGVCTWIADEYDDCTAEEYSSDILPLYQTILVSIQGLGVNAHFLETLAPLLEAPFRGRPDKHVGTVEAFADFWQETYASIPEPQSGWPEQIMRCLEAVAREQEDEASVENLTALKDDCHSPCGSDLGARPIEVKREEDCESEDEGSIVVPSPQTLSRLAGPLLKPTVFSRASTPEPSQLVEPTTPTPKATSRVPVFSTPHSHKPALKDAQVAAVGTSPGSPTRGSFPVDAPTTPKRGKFTENASPTRSQAGKNKENDSPIPHVASATERLAIRSPLLLESILGKRSRLDDDDGGEAQLGDVEKRVKRSKLHMSPLAPSATFMNSVQVHVATQDHTRLTAPTKDDVSMKQEDASGSESESEPPSPTQSTSSVSRKRKGVFLDAVVVPSITEVVRDKRRFSVGGPSLSLDSGTPNESKSHVLRRTRSATKLLGKQAEFQRLENTPKKRRMGRAHQLREEAASAAISSSSRSLRDAPLFGSDDSIMLASPSKIGDLPPSDDEPHIGQITPHRLVSPAVRRVQRIDFNSDPPSDDSIMSDSPSSERVVRKIARLGSEERRDVRPIPLNLRARSVSEFSSFSALGSDL